MLMFLQSASILGIMGSGGHRCRDREVRCLLHNPWMIMGEEEEMKIIRGYPVTEGARKREMARAIG